MKFGAGAGEEPFAKVNELTTDLSNRLQLEASSQASHKSYCDDELAKANEKRADLETQVTTHSSKLEAAVSQSSALDGEVSRDHGCVEVAVKLCCTFAEIQLPRDIGGALCGKRCCSGASGRETDTYISTDEFVERPQECQCRANPEETVEVMKVASQERVQQWSVEQIIDVLVTMHVEAAQAQYIHRNVPVHGRDRNLADHGSKRQLHRSQQQQQHQAVHEEERKEKERRRERARARMTRERRRKRERRGLETQ